MLERADLTIEALAESFAGLRYVVLRLQTKPEICPIAEESAKAQRGIRRDCPSLVDNVSNATHRNADGLRKGFGRQATRF